MRERIYNQVYQILVNNYNMDKSEFEAQTRALHQIRKKINYTLDSTYHDELLEAESIRVQLQAISNRFAPENDPNYARNVKRQWRELQKGPTKNTDVTKWLRQWETLRPEAIRAGMKSVEESGWSDFLDSIQTLSPEFFALWDHDISENGKIPTFERIIALFRAH
jgi:hypothetical protein